MPVTTHMTLVEFLEELVYVAYVQFMKVRNPNICTCRTERDNEICARYH